ncbi:hypothetical protein INR49_001857, partial [Caranx melampygus]
MIDTLCVFQEAESRSKDQIDGTGMSLGNRKGVRVTGKYVTPVDWSGRGAGPSIVHPPPSTHIPPDTPTVISIGPLSHRPPERVDVPKEEEPSVGEDWSRESSQTRASYGEVGVPRQTMEELKTLLRDSPLLSIRGRDEGKPGSPYTYLHASSSSSGRSRSGRDGGGRPDGRQDDGNPHRVFSTFKPHSDASRRGPRSRESTSIQLPTSMDSSSSFRSDGNTNRQPGVSEHSHASSGSWEGTEASNTDNGNETVEFSGNQRFVSAMEQIKQQIARENINFVRVLPWAEQTARVICDPCTVTGSPLRTSPRLIAKQLLGQLQSLGFSLHSSFTYECCVLGAPDRIGPKTLLFPATTLLSNHDLPFFQQLVDSMYCMGADIDSIASASGPGQMEINLRPEFGIAAADSAFTFRTGIKEMARKHSYIASFFTDDGLYNAGVLSHSLWDANGRRSLFHSGDKPGELSEIGRKWLAGLLTHSAALSCLMSPGLGCRSHIAKTIKDPKRMLYATCGSNDNSSSFNIKCHGGRETHIDNKLGSAMANPYIVLAATVAAGLDGIRRNLTVESGLNKAPTQQKEFAIPVKLDDALEALGDDHVIRSTLGEPFVQYFIAMKKFEIETQELDDERN